MITSPLTKSIVSPIVSRITAIAASTTTAVTSNVELIINGTFDTNSDSWPTYGSQPPESITVESGQLNLAGVQHSAVAQIIPTEIGESYPIAAYVEQDGYVQVKSIDGTTIIDNLNNGADGTFFDSFVALETQTIIILALGATGLGVFDNISVSKVVTYLSLPIIGVLTETPLAPGLVAYSGFSADNYLEQPYNSDFDFGTGDFYVMGWFRALSGASSTAYMMRRDRPALNGSGRIILRQSGTSIEFQITSNAATSLPDIYNDGEFHFAVGMREGTDVSLYIDGVEVATATDSSVVGGVDANHILAIGAQPNGNGDAWADSLALWRMESGALTPEQITAIYNAEKHLF